jgi:hypothetical protein
MCSSFYCEHCGTAILDTPGGGAITYCEHYPKETIAEVDDRIDSILNFVDEEKIKQAAKEGALSQRIQVLVWQYIEAPKEQRDATELANAIIDDCKKTL